MNLNLRVFPNRDALLEESLHLLRTVFPVLEVDEGMMLAGGRTPLEIYRRAAAEGYTTRGILFLSDERIVPPDDALSNYGAISPFFPSLLRVRTEESMDVAARLFGEKLASLRAIPLGLLGLGEDGHTSSLFCPEDAAIEDGRLAIPVWRKEKPDRISVTRTLLQRIERIVILATGEEKRAVIKTLLEQPETIPSGIALEGHSRVELWTDVDPR